MYDMFNLVLFTLGVGREIGSAAGIRAIVLQIHYSRALQGFKLP